MKKHVMMALLLGTAVLAAGCSGKGTEKKNSAEVATEAESKTGTADESGTEADSEVGSGTEEAEAETGAGSEAGAQADTETGTGESAQANTETEESAQADTVTEESAQADTETGTGESAQADTETGTGESAQTDAETAAEGQTEAAENAVELGERPDYVAQDYVTLGTYKGLSVVLEPLSVSDDEVELSIREDAAYDALAEVLTEGAVEVGDVANIDYEGKLDGVAFEGGTAQGYDLEIGSHTFIDGFEDGLIGVGIGDTVDLNLTFPEGYGNADLAGQETVFTVTVNSVSRKPELSDEVAGALSDGAYTNLDSYREHVREELLAEKEENQENEIYSDLMSQLYNTCTVNEYPQDLLDYSIASMTGNYQGIAETYGMEFAEFLNLYFGMDEESFAAAVENVVKQNLNYELILMAIAEKEGITLSEEEYQAGCERYVEMYRAQYGFETKEDLEEANGRDAIERSLLMDKVLDFVKDNALIEVLEPETEAETLDGAIEEAVSEPAQEDAETATEAAADNTEEAGTEAAESESEEIVETVSDAAETETETE